MNHQRLAEINAIKANSAYMESDEGVTLSNKKIEEINRHYDQAIEKIMDPDKHERQLRKMREMPLFAAGMRAFDRMRWQLQEGLEV